MWCAAAIFAGLSFAGAGPARSSPFSPEEPAADRAVSEEQSKIREHLADIFARTIPSGGRPAPYAIAELDRKIYAFLARQDPIKAERIDSEFFHYLGYAGNRYREAVEQFFQRHTVHPEAQIVFYFSYIERSYSPLNPSDAPNDNDKRLAIARFRNMLLKIYSIPTLFLWNCEPTEPTAKEIRRLDPETYDLYCFMDRTQETLKDE